MCDIIINKIICFIAWNRNAVIELFISLENIRKLYSIYNCNLAGRTIDDDAIKLFVGQVQLRMFVYLEYLQCNIRNYMRIARIKIAD